MFTKKSRIGILRVIRDISTVCVCFVAITTPLAADEPRRATPAEKQQAGELWARYRKAADEYARGEIVGEAAQLSEPARAVFAGRLQDDFVPLLLAYEHAYEVAAGKARGKLSPAQSQELTEKQAELRSLPGKADLTKEDIEKLGVPAQAKLKETLLPSAAAIAEADGSLAAQREKLLVIDGYVNQLRPSSEAAKGSTYNNAPEAAWTPREQVELMERTALFLSLPVAAAERQTLMNNAKIAGRIDPEECRAIEECNLSRWLAGLPVLALDPALCACARDHSHDMQSLNFFSHESPVEGKKSFGDRAQRMGTSAGAENIYGGGGDRGRGEAAHEGWFHSPGHFQNMLGGYKRIGVGRSGGLFTEMMGW